ADVASHVGAALAGRQRREPAAPLPHVPGAAAGHGRQAEGPHAPGRAVHQRRRLPDEPRQHPRRRHRARRARALSERPHLVRRERHRLDSVRARPDGFRVGGPLPRSRPEDEAERLLAAPVQGDVPVRSDRDEDDPRDGRRDADVGLRLSAPRRRIAAVLEVHRGAVRPVAAGRRPQDHVRERGPLLRAHDMTTGTDGCACHDDLGVKPVAVADELLKKLTGISVPTISGILRRLGYRNTFLAGLSPRTSAQNFAGRAFTARALPTRKDVTPTPLHRRAFETIAAGDVLVIDARGDLSARVTGDILATRLKYRGAAALVADGAVGDLAALQAVGLPVYSRGSTPVSFGESHVMADLNIPVSCAGVLILPGDVL